MFCSLYYICPVSAMQGQESFVFAFEFHSEKSHYLPPSAYKPHLPSPILPPDKQVDLAASMLRGHSKSQTSATRRSRRLMPSTWIERGTPDTSKAANQPHRTRLHAQAAQDKTDLWFLSNSTCARVVDIVLEPNREDLLAATGPMGLTEGTSQIKGHSQLEHFRGGVFGSVDYGDGTHSHYPTPEALR